MASTMIQILLVAAACGLSQAYNYGTVYGDGNGNDPPYMQSLYPLEGPKQGGTTITIQGAGFKDDARLTCRFARLNPQTETTVVKTTAGSYVSPTEMTCDAPMWEEDACPSCVGANSLSGKFMGHTGSPYLRGNNIITKKEIGVGDIISLSAATIGATTPPTFLTQYYTIKAIEECGADPGCWCGGQWAEQAYTVATTYNGTGEYGAAPNSGFEEVQATDLNCALYRYDMITGGARDEHSSVPPTMRNSHGGAECTDANGLVVQPQCNQAWAAGTKITLSEPVYKINGRANQVFTQMDAYRASKFSCTSCKCAGGCEVTVSVTNDGKTWSGSGLGGQVWTGSGLKFSLKDIVPTVQYIDLGLPGYRDSARIMGPASGGTSITVVGENFQDSPLLRCYFAGVHTMVKAEYMSSTRVRCKTPDFFARQYDASGQSQQDGSAKNPHTKVHVTNDGMLEDVEAEGESNGHISRNPYLADDGSKAYSHTFDKAGTYGMDTGAMTNPFRSTCQAGRFPNEGMAPCWGSHGNSMDAPGYGANAAPYSAGNDVLFKYATCYDANPAGAVSSLNLYTGNTVSARPINGSSALGQKITIAQASPNHGNLDDGPLSYLELHLEKPTQPEARLEVSVSAGNFALAGGTMIASETIVVSQITSPQVDYKYAVYFNKPAYLLAGTAYYVQVRHVSGAEDVVWKYTDAAGKGGYSMPDAPSPAPASTPRSLEIQFKLKGYTCDGCRTKYKFDPSTVKNDLKIGSWVGTIEGGKSTYLSDRAADALTGDTNTYRSMLAQEFRPSESGTITHSYLKMSNVEHNDIKQAYVSIWMTRYGKYGEYVCSAYGGSNTVDVCDVDMDGSFNQACALGSVCDPNLALNGGCGDRGACTLAETLTNAHRLRPETGGPAGPCGPSQTCAMTMTLTPDHMKKIKGKTTAGGTWIEFEFKTPVSVEKHTTYFLNAAVVGNVDISKEVVWHSGLHYGDGGAKVRLGNTDGNLDSNAPADELKASFTRQKEDWRWEKNSADGATGGAGNKKLVHVLATKFTRCVSSASQVLSFTTSGEKTGCCSARASPQGGDKGSTVSITGRNFFPSDDLRCVFRNEDGTTGAIQPGVVTDYSYSTMTCKAPTMNPHSARDCSNPALCQGTVLVVTNDGFTVGPQYLGPKWMEPTGSSAIPAYLGLNPMKFLFSDIWVSTTGSDVVGDGTKARPYNTIQRAVDAANEYDQIVLMPGYYTGLGNRGLRHHGKRLAVKSATIAAAAMAATATGSAGNLAGGSDGDLQNTFIDCEHAPDGFILNNNKDSDSPFAGFIDTEGIITKNCENLRIYDI